MSEYRSVVYYQQRHQRWMETVKVCTGLRARGLRWDGGCHPPGCAPHSSAPQDPAAGGDAPSPLAFWGSKAPGSPAWGGRETLLVSQLHPWVGAQGEAMAAVPAGKRSWGRAPGVRHGRWCSCDTPGAHGHAPPALHGLLGLQLSPVSGKPSPWVRIEAPDSSAQPSPKRSGAWPAGRLSLCPPALTRARVLPLRSLFLSKTSTRPTCGSPSGTAPPVTVSVPFLQALPRWRSR